MAQPVLQPPSGRMSHEMKGVWWLLSREDWTVDGHKRIDPVLGADPVGILTYTATHFAAQFMKRDRNGERNDQQFTAGKNNTGAVNGYDAYFGTYEVNEETGAVLHTLTGSINPANVGITVSRELRVSGEHLVIQLQTTTHEGESVVRTLTWKRLN